MDRIATSGIVLGGRAIVPGPRNEERGVLRSTGGAGGAGNEKAVQRQLTRQSGGSLFEGRKSTSGVRDVMVRGFGTPGAKANIVWARQAGFTKSKNVRKA